MTAPRLRFAAIGTDFGADALESALLKAGHQIDWPVAWEDIPDYSAVLLRLSAADLPDAIQRLESCVIAQHIVIHTALEVGADPLLELPAVGMALHRLANGDVVVDTNDEVAATVAAVLVGELQGNPVMVPAEERPALANALRLVAQARKLQVEALHSVHSEAAKDLLDRLCTLY